MTAEPSADLAATVPSVAGDTHDEQQRLDQIYARLDRMRANTKTRLRTALGERTDGQDVQALSERESYERLYTDDLAKFDAAEHNLYFGRLDLTDGEIRAIGRIGILDDDAADTTLLLDWRAPLARPFYLATPAAPEGVRRRRHIRTRNRRLTATNDEVLDGAAASPLAEATSHGDVVNESALLSALNAARTGQMTDIVETIQREQDEIIRTPHRGVVVVQGGPGTGKTAVALHRAAYLLYTHREQLARSGVLIIGPNQRFLHYIEQVLPSLGESGVLLATMSTLYPGITATRRENARAAVLKGSLDILAVLRAAVRDRQRIPREPVELTFDGHPLLLDKALVSAARGKARSSRRPHNEARKIFMRQAISALAAAHAQRIGSSLVDGSQLLNADDIADIRDEISEDPAITAALDRLWPQLNPPELLQDVLTNAAALKRCTSGWSPEDREAVLVTDSFAFSPSDVPLLDELAELIGDDPAAQEAEQRRQWREQLAAAQDALDILSGSAPQDLDDEFDAEILMAYDLIDADTLARRQQSTAYRTTAERAHGDRTWTYGHVIIDEAQELSEMDWRTIMRRSPNRWMTVIGDTAQTGSPAGARSWGQRLEPYVKQRWKRFDLTVNYRTPTEIMDVAAEVLAELDPQAAPPRSIRRAGRDVVVRHVTADELSTAAWELVPSIADGVVGIIVPDRLLADTVAAGATDRVSVMTVADSKGLEFDAVVVVEPAEIVAQNERGLGDLYVALTRATQELAVVHAAPLPASVRRGTR